jgi:hypothetical protein
MAAKTYNKGVVYENLVYTPDTDASGWAGIEIGDVYAMAVKDFDEAQDTSITMINKTDFAIGTKATGTGSAIVAGKKLYRIPSTGIYTTTASLNILMGICKKDASDADSTIEMTFDGNLYNLD